MIGRSALTRGAQLALRRQNGAKLAQRRAYAATAGASTETASFESTEINNIKVASRDPRSPTTRLTVVAKAGTRYQPMPGLSIGLEEFAFKNTDKRSALRITRESELLGGQLKSYHTREALIVEAAFLREDLPYYTELLGEVITKTRYTTHEFHEEVEGLVHLKQSKLAHNALAQALDNAHAVAFHKGLGSSLYPSSTTPLGPYLSENSIAAFAQAVYTKPNIAIVADGATQDTLSKWIDPFFRDVPSSSTSPLQLFTEASKYYGGEQRTSLSGRNALVIAFPGFNLSSDKAEVAILTALLGGESNIKWSPGFSLLGKAAAAAPGASVVAKNLAYTDAGLLTIQVTGSPVAVRKGAEEAVKALKSVVESGVTKEVLTKAIAKAKFDLLSANELTGSGMVSAGNSLIHGGKIFEVASALKSYEAVTADKVKAAAKELLDGKATVAATGDLYVLPYAEELGLKVRNARLQPRAVASCPDSRTPPTISIHSLAPTTAATEDCRHGVSAKYLSSNPRAIRHILPRIRDHSLSSLQTNNSIDNMISDDTLYKLANYLGSVAVLFILGYHWIETNSKDRNQPAAAVNPAGKTAATLK